MAWAAAAGIVINLLSARLFGHDHHHDLNQRAAVLHLLTDAAVSVAVLFSALVVGATGWLWLDAVTAIGVGAAVIWSALGLLREAIALNLDAAPRYVDLLQWSRRWPPCLVCWSWRNCTCGAEHLAHGAHRPCGGRSAAAGLTSSQP